MRGREVERGGRGQEKTNKNDERLTRRRDAASIGNRKRQKSRETEREREQQTVKNSKMKKNLGKASRKVNGSGRDREREHAGQGGTRCVYVTSEGATQNANKMSTH